MGILPDEKEAALRDEIYEVIKKREQARENKKWKQADKLRDTLKDKWNIIVEDTPFGSRWKKS